MQKFAAWKASDLRKAIREGRDPTPRSLPSATVPSGDLDDSMPGESFWCPDRASWDLCIIVAWSMHAVMSYVILCVEQFQGGSRESCISAL